MAKGFTHDISLSPGSSGSKQSFYWMTDLHLDALPEEKWKQFFRTLSHEAFEALLIGGDVVNGINSLKVLKEIEGIIERPLYFVLGNHDFYYGSIEKIRKLAKALAMKKRNLHYLTYTDPIPLSADVALVGHDGWSDARTGNFLASTIMLNDYLFIDELKKLKGRDLEGKLQELGSDAASSAEKVLLKALSQFKKVLFLTHSPPFREACLYEGKVCDDNWGPHFVATAVGQMLLQVAKVNPDKSILVLSGHSHEKADVVITENVRVLSGKADLGSLCLQGVIRL